MKKFVGSVNGKSFDNEKDFNEAANEAIKKNDGNLSISSYYSYNNEEKEEKKDDHHLPSSEYIVVSNGTKNEDGQYDYPLSDELKKKLEDATNDSSIQFNVKKAIELYNQQIIYNENKQKDLISHIDAMEKEKKALTISIGDCETEKKTLEDNAKQLYAKKKYYNSILEIIEKKIKDKELEEDDKQKVIEKNEECHCPYDIQTILGMEVLKFLRQLGGW